jgi:hypothetical protein
MDISSVINETLFFVWKIFSWIWWIILPWYFFKKFTKLWLEKVRLDFLKSAKFNLLEIKVPKDLIGSPKSMENFFATLHATRMFLSGFKNKYVKGKIQLPLSLEIVGDSTGIKFYIRTPKEFRNLVESQIYAQYPNAEISEVDDYVNNFSTNIPNTHFDLWGADFVLEKDFPYPIKTYQYFEEEDEGKRVDPMASLIEVLGKLKGEDKIWFQILIKYTNSSWKKFSDVMVDVLTGKMKPPKKTGLFFFSNQFLRNLVKAPMVSPEWDFVSGGGSKGDFVGLTTGKKEIIEAIENKASKLGFESLVRFIYLAPRNSFDMQNISSIMGAIQQFSTQNMNSFKPSFLTVSQGLFKNRKEFMKKRDLHFFYKFRVFNPKKISILNTEELSTIFHFPMVSVSSSFLSKVEAKKGEPPIDLPIK